MVPLQGIGQLQMTSYCFIKFVLFQISTDNGNNDSDYGNDNDNDNKNNDSIFNYVKSWKSVFYQAIFVCQVRVYVFPWGSAGLTLISPKHWKECM